MPRSSSPSDPLAPVLRTVLVRFTPEHRTDADRTAVVAAAREAFPSLPGVTSFRAGVALDDDWDVLLLVGFDDASAVEPYRVSAGHVAFVEDWLKPRMETILARNFALGPLD